MRRFTAVTPAVARQSAVPPLRHVIPSLDTFKHNRRFAPKLLAAYVAYRLRTDTVTAGVALDVSPFLSEQDKTPAAPNLSTLHWSHNG